VDALLRTVLFALAFTVLALIATPAGAASLTVNSLGDEADSNPGNGVCSTGLANCTLRAAIQEANALAGDDTISFGVTGTIELTSPLPNITTPLVINGPGASNLTVDGNATGAVFAVSGTVSIADLTITGGSASGVSNFGTLTMSRVTVTANTATHGGGVATWVDSELTMTNSSVSLNSSSVNGGGLHASAGATISLSNSTVSGNTATGEAVASGCIRTRVSCPRPRLSTRTPRAG
jgi:CSLREA domain-containing protein